ncbi:hypothetical protein PSTG_17749 [Puccinia striiformis f. sp. tritici PST-78]|uniref:Tc1-like transposase DDE domain-containing protein n=1 Tax=Puccinia striiformis f. sp. tritici PST-78 TaxID=1165861 RepID=A0A0L0UNY6_9BASI|nr:hypothetical protein PSTG_17749 [Puccinia striiformis f. sp. tritici PST-78]
MGYRKYSAKIKYAAVIASINGKNLSQINKSLAASISSDSISRWRKLYERTRAVVCNPQTYRTRGRPFELNDEDLAFIREMIDDKPTVYLDEIQRALTEEHGITVSLSTISNTLHLRLHLSKKTIRTVHPRQDPEQRADYVSRIGCIQSSCLVFTDECGVSLEVVARKTGWALVGKRTPRVPRERSTHGYNIIPAISTTGLVAHMVQEETVERFDFEYFLEHILLPSMNPYPAPRNECGVSLEVVARKTGWALVGKRTPRVPRERSTHGYNIIPAISTTGLVAHMVQEETVERFDFEYFLEHILLPSMNPYPAPRSVLVLDNAQIHHNGRVAQLVEEQGCLIQYLPPYSPDLNPIEKGFSVYKSVLRRNEDLLTGGEEDYEVIEAFVSWVFTGDLIRHLFRGSGYDC